MSWYVLSLQKKQELKVEETLNKIGIEVFSPYIKGVKYWSDRERVFSTPLFKSHVFIRVEEKYKGIVFGISGVKGYVSQEGKPVILTNQEVNSIRQWLLEEDYDISLLNQLIENKQISVENWFMTNNSRIKAIGTKNIFQHLYDVNIILKEKLKDVV